jgi:dipeptidyl aminopeptidase/acylaminoacyl peptidase
VNPQETEQSSQPKPEKTPLSFKEIADRLVPAHPQCSPDGSMVAFTAAPYGRKDEHGEGAIWLSRNGQLAEPFTGGTAVDKEPRWSPDGNELAFLSDRKERGEFRPYRIRLNGGEAKPVGELIGSISHLRWSPNGEQLALLRREPETKEEKKREEDRDDAELVDGNPRQNRLWVVDIDTGKARQMTYGAREVWSFSWAPDGASIAFVTSEETGHDSPICGGDLWIVATSGTAPRHLAHFVLMPSHLTFVDGPDGPLIALHSHGHRDHPADSVYTIPLAGGEPRNLLPEYPGNVDAIAEWPCHPGRLAVRMVEGVHTRIYSLDLTDKSLQLISPQDLADNGTILSTPSFSADGTKMVFVWANSVTPDEVHVADVGQSSRPVTEFGKPFMNRLRPSEVVRWDSDGVEIQGLLTLPTSAGNGPVPLVVMVHGGPSWQWEDMCYLDWHDWTQMLVSRGIAVLAPNPRGSTGRGSDFQRLLHDDVGGGESRDLVTGAEAMVERGIADPDCLGIGGWSWGGYLTAFTITQTPMFKAAVMGAGLSNLISDHGQDDIPHANLLYFPGQPYHHLDQYWQASPIRHVSNCTTPTLIVHGDADARVHPAQGMEMYRALKILGIPVEFVRYPREEHSFQERLHQIDLMRRISEWYERWLLS